MDTMTHPNSHLFKFWQRRQCIEVLQQFTGSVHGSCWGMKRSNSGGVCLVVSTVFRLAGGDGDELYQRMISIVLPVSDFQCRFWEANYDKLGNGKRKISNSDNCMQAVHNFGSFATSLQNLQMQLPVKEVSESPPGECKTCKVDKQSSSYIVLHQKQKYSSS